MEQSKRKWWFLLMVVIVVVGLDQMTKRMVIDNLARGESIQPIPFLSAVFQITHAANTGAAFGFLSQAGDIFLLIAVVVTAAMLYYYPRIPATARFTRLASGLVVGGALGNALDRLQHGEVIDFIHYQIPGVISNVSNLADHAIVIGVGLILLDSWLTERRQKQEPSSDPLDEGEAVTDAEGRSQPM